MTDATMQLEEPAFITLQSSDGQISKRFDVFVVRRMLETAQAQPTEERRWSRVMDWLSEQLEIPRDALAENMACQLQNAINALVTVHNERLKKSVASTVSSLLSTQESPVTT